MAELPLHDQAGAWYRDVPRSIGRQAVFGFALMALTFGGFGVWAFRAPLAAAVIAHGSFVATGQNKVVQHLEGGIIQEILVQEGDQVAQGDVLLRLDETLARANSRELHLRRIRLEATEARLAAEHLRRATLVFPAHLDAERSDPEVAVILDGQLVAFTVARSGMTNDISLLMRNVEALDMRARGYTTQLSALRGQMSLLNEDLDSKNELLERGLIRRSEVLALRRALLEADGQVGRLEAEINEISEMRYKFATQIEKTLDEYSGAALGQLQTIQSELESVREQARKAANILGRTDVVAPVTGTVVRLFYHTAGGVIESGRAIAEILPADAPLIVEVLVPRSEIDQVSVGQHATVRLTGLNQRTTPVLNGTIDYLSADAVADTANQMVREVYIARVTLTPEELHRVRGFTPTPGMPAEIMIQTTERTFAQYIAKPIVDSMARAFREQ